MRRFDPQKLADEAGFSGVLGPKGKKVVTLPFHTDGEANRFNGTFLTDKFIGGFKPGRSLEIKLLRIASGIELIRRQRLVERIFGHPVGS